MMKSLKYVLLLLIPLMSSGGLQAQKVGDPAPDFSYKDTQGNTLSLSAYSGKVVFVFVFGYACPFCKTAGPDTESKIQGIYGGMEDFQAIGVDVWDGSVPQVNDFRSTTGVSYPLLTMGSSLETLYSTTYDRLLVVDQNGILRHKSSTGAEYDVENTASVIEELLMLMTGTEPSSGIKETFSAVYPNPASDRAGIRFSLAEKGRVSLRLFNTLGQELDQLIGEIMPAGDHERNFDVSGLKRGVYFLRLDTPDGSSTRKFQVSR